jgi:[protein-PII] uridylyltransferase
MPGASSSSLFNLSAHLCSEASVLINRKTDGFSITAELTRQVDDVIMASYAASIGNTDNAGMPEMSLLAVGGYGRSEMMPYSDIDIMLLARADSKAEKTAVQSLLYQLWDQGLNISHSFRTLRGCVDDAMKDLHTRTAMIDTRFIAGSRRLYEEFRRDCYPKLLFRGGRNFTGEIMREVERRYRDAGGSLYLLEPNVKEGRGGLRDIHTISWLSRSQFKIYNTAEYGKFLSALHLRDFISAHQFFLSMRASIHVCSGRKNDILTAELHDKIASMMKFHDTRRFYASEIMMRVFYMKSKTVSDALRKVMNHCGKRYFSLPASFSIKKINADFSISKNEIIVRDTAIFQNIGSIMEAFCIYSSTGKPFSMQVEEALKARSYRIHKEDRSSKSAIAHFREILKGNRVYETLKKMHDTYVLDRFIPEFGRIRHLIILEAFHRYTVDEHTLIAIRNLESLKKTSDGKLQILSEILRRVNQEVLYAAILFHDIGKGVSRNHEEAGYLIIGNILERLSYSQPERQAIEFLVRNHIVLSRDALSRDIDAPETIVGLAEIADSEENLKALYLMTYADMSAVNPFFWNEWKASLLHELYARTLQHIRGVVHDPYAQLESDVSDFAREMPERYLLSSTADEIKRDYTLSLAATRDKLAVTITERGGSTYEMIVVAGLTPGLFPMVVGVLSERGLNIARARLFAGNRNIMVCKIVISNWKDLFWDGMEAGIKNALQKAILMPATNPIKLSLSAETIPVARRHESLLEIDNEANCKYTILEVKLPDKIGLLYDIAIRLYKHKIDILSAIINTDDGMAHDVFYVHKESLQLGTQDCMSILGDLLSIGETA